MTSKPQMTALLPAAELGLARIAHIEVSDAAAKLHNMRCAFDPRRTRYTISPGGYAQLYVGSELMMSDTDAEWFSNQSVLYHANGDVLVAGLGLGMILHPLLQNPAVRSVTVVEKYTDVIALVAPSLESPKLTIVEGDIFTLPLPKGTTWDTIYFDIWPDITEDNLPEMTRLKRRFARRLRRSNPRAWMACWRESEIRYWK